MSDPYTLISADDILNCLLQHMDAYQIYFLTTIVSPRHVWRSRLCRMRIRIEIGDKDNNTYPDCHVNRLASAMKIFKNIVACELKLLGSANRLFEHVLASPSLLQLSLYSWNHMKFENVNVNLLSLRLKKFS